MKVTKRMIDETSGMFHAMTEAEKEYKAKKKAYDLAIKPIIKYVEEDLNLPSQKAAELKGAHSVLEIGKQRETEVITDHVEALRRLEAKEQGLGFSLMTLTLKAMRDNLAPADFEDLLTVKHGKRHVKATELEG